MPACFILPSSKCDKKTRKVEAEWGHSMCRKRHVSCNAAHLQVLIPPCYLNLLYFILPTSRFSPILYKSSDRSICINTKCLYLLKLLKSNATHGFGIMYLRPNLYVENTYLIHRNYQKFL